jgi:hypothetical protein
MYIYLTDESNDFFDDDRSDFYPGFLANFLVLYKRPISNLLLGVVI